MGNLNQMDVKFGKEIANTVGCKQQASCNSNAVKQTEDIDCLGQIVRERNVTQTIQKLLCVAQEIISRSKWFHATPAYTECL